MREASWAFRRLGYIAPLALLIVRAAAAQGPTAPSPVDTLRWLAGCWRMTGGTTIVDEQWMAPAGGMMMGMSRTVVAGRVREFETLRISAAGDTLIYAASPSGQQPTEFRSSLLRPGEVHFENPAHDFPQRIRYRLASPSVLVATIEGDRDGRRRPVVFTYSRARCPDGGAATPTSPAASGPSLGEAAVRAALQPRYDQLAERESASLGSVNDWFAEHADPSFVHVMWTAGGTAVPVARADVLAGAGERMRLANLGASFRDRRYSHALDKVLVRDDTADVLIVSQHAWILADTAGRYGPRGADVERNGLERRVDRWIRTGTDWRLRQATVIGQEVRMAGRLVLKDGKPEPQP